MPPLDLRFRRAEFPDIRGEAHKTISLAEECHARDNFFRQPSGKRAGGIRGVERNGVFGWRLARALKAEAGIISVG